MLSLISLLSLHAALAAAPVPVQLPPAEPQRDWPQLLAEAGLGLGAPGGWGASVADPGDGTTWQVHLVDKSGAAQDLVVLIPTNESERADLVWYLAKLLGAEPPPLEPIPPQPFAAAPIPTPAPVAQAPAPPVQTPAAKPQPAPPVQTPAAQAPAAPVQAPAAQAPAPPVQAPVAPPVQAPAAQAPAAPVQAPAPPVQTPAAKPQPAPPVQAPVAQAPAAPVQTPAAKPQPATPVQAPVAQAPAAPVQAPAAKPQPATPVQAPVAQAPAPPVQAPPAPVQTPAAKPQPAPPVQAPVAQAPAAPVQTPVAKPQPAPPVQAPAPTVQTPAAQAPATPVQTPAATQLSPELLAKIPVARSLTPVPNPEVTPQFFARAALSASVRGMTGAAVVPELTAGVHAGLLRAGAYGALRSAAQVSGVGENTKYGALEVGAGVWAMPDLPVGGGLLGGVSVRSFTAGGNPVTSIAIPVVAAEALGHFTLGKTGFASHIGVEPLARVQVDLRSVELQLRRGDTVNSTIALPGWDLRLGVGFTWN